VIDGLPANADHAQIRIFRNGEVLGGGTVVAPNWVLTASHFFARIDSTAYSIRFGTVDDSGDSASTSNLRAIDRIVLHPQLADVAMVHFAVPVPATVGIPPLASQAPPTNAVGILYGWAPTGRSLYRGAGLIIDPVASANAASMRELIPAFATSFPAGLDPSVLNLDAGPGDSGGGVFDRTNTTLLGVHVGTATYIFPNASGNLAGRTFSASYQMPLWALRSWIQQTIDGTGSTPPDPHDELKRRRLSDTPAGHLPMTQPPQTDPVPEAPIGTLTAGSDTPGKVTVTCRGDGQGNGCSVDSTSVDVGNSTPFPIGSPRQVAAWCWPAGTGSGGHGTVRVSFTNRENADTSNPVAFGWWDVDASQITFTQTPTNPATCQ
jgi:hypothetical protein